MKNVSTEWIKKLIRENRLEEFYSCSTWKKYVNRKKDLNITNVNAVGQKVNTQKVKLCTTKSIYATHPNLH